MGMIVGWPAALRVMVRTCPEVVPCPLTVTTSRVIQLGESGKTIPVYRLPQVVAR